MHKNYEIKLLTKSHIEEVASMTAKAFSKGPLIVTDSAYSEDDDFERYLVYVADKCSDEKLGLIAKCKETDQIIGSLLACDLADTWNDENFRKEAEDDPMISMLYKINKEYFKDADIEKNEYLNIKFLAVSGAYAGRGIAAELVKESLKLASERGYKFAHTESTGIGSQRVFINKLGFEEKGEIDCNSFVFEGRTPFSSSEGRTTMKLTIKELSK